MIEWVIFDIDNTLYSYDNCHKKAIKCLREYACGEFGITETEFDLKFAAARERVKAQLGNTGAAHNRMLYMQAFLEETGEKPLKKALEMYDIYWNTMLEEMELYPYVRPLMSELKKRGIKIGILTDLTTHIQHRKLRELELEEFVDVLVTSEEAGEEKPSARAFSCLIEKTGANPSAILMIGDSS